MLSFGHNRGDYGGYEAALRSTPAPRNSQTSAIKWQLLCIQLTTERSCSAS